MMKLTGIHQLIMNAPINIVEITEKEIKKLTLLKEGELFRPDDLVYLVDNKYAVISEDSKLLKQKTSKHDKVYRRTKKR